ncbi:MAG: GTP-binding protein, partial [Planctomycetes bacterium]|nr:GTP-binding protein [Planctomycetota bacterium]
MGEDLVVCRRDPSTVEVHCHGGSASIAQVVAHLTAAGCEPTDWRRWLADQTEDLLVCEAHAALADASTLRTATILLDQYHGALRREVTAIRQVLSSGAVDNGREKLCGLLRYAELGQHLTQPWRVVIAGLPNVGKSSLINALVGYQRAIVFDQPGTTRDVVSASTAIEGWPVKLSDTAGLHPTSDELESAGIALAHDQLAEADLVVWVLDAETVESQTAASLDKLVGQQ